MQSRKEELSDFDEYPIHQIAAPVAQVASTHPEFADRYHFNAHDKTGGADLIYIGFGCYPNKSWVGAGFGGRIGGTDISGHWERAIQNDRHVARVGPLSFTVIEPFRRWRVALEKNETGVSFDLEFTARTRPCLFAPMHWEKQGRVALDQQHMLQSGNYRGWICVGDKKMDVGRWWGERDHSWGMRVNDEVNLWLWPTAQFRDYSIGAWLWEDEDGVPVYCGGAVMRENGEEMVPFVKFSHDIELVEGSGWRPIVRGRLDLVDANGGVVNLTFREIMSVRQEHLMEFRHGDNVGYGVIEMLSKSPHKRYFPR